MSKLITLNIDLTKIDKSKIVEGKKGKYLNLVVAERKEKDNYGNTHTIYIQQSKEERQDGAAKQYIGSGKEIELNNIATAPSQSKQEDDTDLPF